MLQNLRFRNFRGEADFSCLASILSASEHADSLPLNITASDMTGFMEQFPGLDLYRDVAIAEVDGQAAGWGEVHWREEGPRRIYRLSGYIRPEQRRTGIGQALLDWLENRALEMAAEHPSKEAALMINATQYQVGLHALARNNGYRVKESWVLMVRPSLEDIPDVPLPAGLETRPALPEHYAAIWRAVCEAYVPEGGPPPEPGDDMPEEIRNDPNFQPALWQVAWDTAVGKVAGSVMTYINHAENQQLGILRGFTEGISTVPAWQRRGVATALIARSLHALRAEGMTESALVCSGEKPDNMRLYTHCGFQEVKRDTVYEKPSPGSSVL